MPRSSFRIGVDARPLAIPLTGIGVAVREILREMALLDPGAEFFCYAQRNGDQVARVLPAGNRFVVREGQGPGARWGTGWIHWNASRLLAADRLDVFWGTNLVLPTGLRGKVPLVVTCHDLVFRLYPETLSWRNRLFLAPVAGRSFRAADLIIAISETTARDLARFYPIGPSRVRVVPLAAGQEFQPLDPAPVRDHLRRQFGLERDYVLFVGTLEPRKNLGVFLRAMAEVTASSSFSGDVVVVGGKGWRMADAEVLAHNHPLRDRLRFLGYVAATDLPFLYAGAQLFVMPSQYEGFGLPVLEAMAAGTPVITTTGGALAEVSGGAAQLVPPGDDQALAAAISELLDDEARRETLRKLGLDRARAFTWRASAEAMLQALREVSTRS